MDAQGEANFKTAVNILKLLGTDKKLLYKSIVNTCVNCDTYGPRDGKSCASLRLVRELGCDYTPPEWCKDKSHTEV